MTNKRLMKAWQKDLGAELGAALDLLASAAEEPWLSADLLLDSQGSDRPISLAQQKRLGIYVLGRTSQGVFGVSRDGSGEPVAERPVFFAPFALDSATIVAPNLHTFLTTHASLREVHEPMKAAFSAALSSKATTKKPAAASRARAPKLTLADKKSVAADRVKRYLMEGPRAISLLVDLEEVSSSGTRIEIVLGTQLPASLEGQFSHPVLISIEDGVRAAVREQLGDAAVRYVFVGDDEAPRFAPLRTLVTKCPGETEEVRELIDDAERAWKASKRS